MERFKCIPYVNLVLFPRGYLVLSTKVIASFRETVSTEFIYTSFIRVRFSFFYFVSLPLIYILASNNRRESMTLDLRGTMNLQLIGVQ